VIVGI